MSFAPQIREAFAAFDLTPIETTYTIGTKAVGGGQPAAELLISNFSIP